MQGIEPQKTQPLLLRIPEAMRRYGFTERTGFIKYRQALVIPSPGRAPFPVPHILRMDECWISENLPSLKLNRVQYKNLVMANYKTLRTMVRIIYEQDIENLIEQSTTEFQDHPIVQTYLQRLHIEENPNAYRRA